MIQAFLADRADETFDVSILPGRAGCGWSIPDAHRPNSVSDDGAVACVSVVDEVTGSVIPREGSGDLAGDPFRRWVGGDVGPDQTVALKMDIHQPIEKLEAGCWYDKQIYSSYVWGVIAEKGLPAL